MNLCHPVLRLAGSVYSQTDINSGLPQNVIKKLKANDFSRSLLFDLQSATLPPNRYLDEGPETATLPKKFSSSIDSKKNVNAVTSAVVEPKNRLVEDLKSKVQGF